MHPTCVTPIDDAIAELEDFVQSALWDGWDERANMLQRELDDLRRRRDAGERYAPSF